MINNFNFDNPVSVCVCSEGKWRKATTEITLENSAVFLTTTCASWVRIEWAADFSEDAVVLGDAWERSYGDLHWKPIGEPAFHPWYFTVKENDLVRCFGMKTGPAALCSWRATRRSIALLLDVRCGCRDTKFDERKVLLAELVSLEKQGDTFSVMHDFCRMMCPNPVLPPTPVYGGDDWYANYSDNSFEKILSHARKLAECSEGLVNRPYQMVDAGWQICHHWYGGEEYIGGPYKYCNDNFGNMKDMADAIKELGVKPGLWLRPLETVEYVPDKAFLRKEDKRIKYLDPSHPYSKRKLSEDIQRFREWGYDMIKHDFATVDIFGRYGNFMNESVVEGDWAFYEEHKTSAEIIKEYYLQTAEDAKGAVINACNTLSHLSAGIFPIYRIGDDTSGLIYSRTVKMGVNTLAFRGSQNNAFYTTDPDCVGITSKIPWEKNKEWLRLLKYSGMMLFASIADASYTNEVREALTDAFAVASEYHETARPIDWMDTETPHRWQTFDGEKEFDWIV